MEVKRNGTEKTKGKPEKAYWRNLNE